MKVSDFNFDLPEELIAQFPPENRTDSRLLKVFREPNAFEDTSFSSILDDIRKGDLVILNDTKVLPARLFGKKDTGGKLEILLERVTGPFEFLCQIRASRAPKIGQSIAIDGDDSAELTVIGREGSFFRIQASIPSTLFAWLEDVGHMPLPPYIERGDELSDQNRYQTVFAKEPGAVAAPTAGLHYDEDLLDKIRHKGAIIKTVTLHVGAGTYQPVRVESINEHQMHSEAIEVSQEVCDAVIKTKESGGKIIAVGTTVVRSLESAALKSSSTLIEAYVGDTDIFIYPGYEFRIVDMLQTNFHLPESTLLMLVSAFSGYDRIMAAYNHAIENRYRFFSYGDAMLLEKAKI